MPKEPQPVNVTARLEDIKHKNMDNYDDIIDMPHHTSKVHRPMPRQARAAQFASFAALKGHNDAIDSTAKKHIEEFERESYTEE